tara:strand:+ start:1011 stop:1232 length:222 start_codon:yes stop_codon:yes gene_type:complete
MSITVRYFFTDEVLKSLEKFNPQSEYTDHLTNNDIKNLVRFNLSEQLFSGMPLSKVLYHEMKNRNIKMKNILH